MALTLATGYWGFREQTPRNYFQIASELGVNYVEVPMYEQVKTASHLSETELWDYRNPQSRKELRESAEDAGVTMVAGTSNIPISPEVHLWNNDASHEFAMATARRAIDISADLASNCSASPNRRSTPKRKRKLGTRWRRSATP